MTPSIRPAGGVVTTDTKVASPELAGHVLSHSAGWKHERGKLLHPGNGHGEMWAALQRGSTRAQP